MRKRFGSCATSSRRARTASRTIPRSTSVDWSTSRSCSPTCGSQNRRSRRTSARSPLPRSSAIDQRSATLYAGMAKTHQDQGDLEAAIVYNQKSLQIFEELGLFDQVACTLDNAALLYAEYGNRERARECLTRAAAARRRNAARRHARVDQSLRSGGDREDRSEARARDGAGGAQVRAQGRPARRAGAPARPSRRAAHEREARRPRAGRSRRRASSRRSARRTCCA